jgi:hypothetical protein
MKTITFPVGYRPNYLQNFLGYLKRYDLSDYTIICSAEKHQPCIDILNNSDVPLIALLKQNSSGVKSHSGARDNMYNVLSYAFNELKTDFNVHLEDDFLLSPDVFDLANWYYETFKDKPMTYVSYGLFNHESRGEDYAATETITTFEGLGWCTFKEGWETCFNKYWYNDVYARKHFNAYGWDWAMSGAYREFGFKGIRPLIARTNHDGRHGGTCCTVEHHDRHYGNLKWNQTEVVKEFKLPTEPDRDESKVMGAIM